MQMINALGSEPKDILRHLQCGTWPPTYASTRWTSQRAVHTSEVRLPLPPIPERLKRYQCRNNAMVQHTLQAMDPDIQRIIQTYGKHRIGVVMGSSTTGIGAGENAIQHKVQYGSFPEEYDYIQQELGATSSFIAEYLGLQGPCYTLSTACSSSAHVFGSGRNLLQMGLCDAVIVGGADSLCRMTVQGFASLGATSSERCNPMSRNRDGIHIGEGAALFILEHPDAVPETSQGVRLLGVGSSSDAHHISAPDPTGQGAEASMRNALEDAQLQPSDVGYINLHGTGTVLNDAMESLAVERIFGLDTPCSSTKPLVGHMLGAAAATEIGFCWLLLHHASTLPPHIWDQDIDPQLPALALTQVEQHLKPSSKGAICLSNSFAFGGNNCSVILGLPS